MTTHAREGVEGHDRSDVTPTGHSSQEAGPTGLLVRDVVESDILKDMKSKTSVVAYLALAAYGEREEVPTHEDLAAVVGVRRNAVADGLRELEDRGLIEIDRSHHPHKVTVLPLIRGHIPDAVAARERAESARKAERARRMYDKVAYRSDLERAVAVALDAAKVPFAYEVPYGKLFPDLIDDDRTLDFLISPILGIEVAGWHSDDYTAAIEEKKAVCSARGVRLLVVDETTLHHLKAVQSLNDKAWTTADDASMERLLAAIPAARHTTLTVSEVELRLNSRRSASRARTDSFQIPGTTIFIPRSNPDAAREAEAKRLAAAQRTWTRMSENAVGLMQSLDKGIGTSVEYVENLKKLRERIYAMVSEPTPAAAWLVAEQGHGLRDVFRRVDGALAILQWAGEQVGETWEERAARLDQAEREREQDRTDLLALRERRRAEAAAQGLPDPYAAIDAEKAREAKLASLLPLVEKALSRIKDTGRETHGVDPEDVACAVEPLDFDLDV